MMIKGNFLVDLQEHSEGRFSPPKNVKHPLFQIWAAIDLFAIWLFENVLRHFAKVNTEQICSFESSGKK